LRARSPFAIGNRKSKIENVVVPVVQRIERRFPKDETDLLSHVVSSRLSYANYLLLIACTGSFVVSRHLESAHFYAAG
jgi:hypothetical protein